MKRNVATFQFFELSCKLVIKQNILYCVFGDLNKKQE